MHRTLNGDRGHGQLQLAVQHQLGRAGIECLGLRPCQQLRGGAVQTSPKSPSFSTLLAPSRQLRAATSMCRNDCGGERLAGGGVLCLGVHEGEGSADLVQKEELLVRREAHPVLFALLPAPSQHAACSTGRTRMIFLRSPYGMNSSTSSQGTSAIATPVMRTCTLSADRTAAPPHQIEMLEPGHGLRLPQERRLVLQPVSRARAALCMHLVRCARVQQLDGTLDVVWALRALPPVTHARRTRAHASTRCTASYTTPNCPTPTGATACARHQHTAWGRRALRSVRVTAKRSSVGRAGPRDGPHAANTSRSCFL